MAETETVATTTTPAETVADTSETVEPVETTTDTSTTEPVNMDEAAGETAETETKKLYADKYENVEELEKGYKELQGSFTKAKEWETKYNELLKTQEQANQQREREQLQQAQKRGFNSFEEQQIADNVTLAEYQYYANYLNTISPEYTQEVSNLLSNYYQSGNKAYLEEAKRYYSSDFIEAVAVEKNKLKSRLENEFKAKKDEAKRQSDEKLGNAIKEQYADFLSDIQENEGKALALKLFCNSGIINSLEDMQTFVDTFNKVASLAGQRAIKELEAQKAIEEAKNKAVIPTDSQPQSAKDTELPTADELKRNPKLYSKAVKKWGMDTVDSIIMKG